MPFSDEPDAAARAPAVATCGGHATLVRAPPRCAPRSTCSSRKDAGVAALTKRVKEHSIRRACSIPAACGRECRCKPSFTLAQLADPQIAESEKILRACVHCGFCTATCPTYVLLGDELDSPRGRIYLIKEMLEHDRAGDARGRQAHRPLPVVPRLHDDVPVRRALHAPRRSRAARISRRPTAGRCSTGCCARCSRAVLPYPTPLPARAGRAALLGAAVRAAARRASASSALAAMLRLAAAQRLPAPPPRPRGAVFPAEGERKRPRGAACRLHQSGADAADQRSGDPAAQPPRHRSRDRAGRSLLRLAGAPHGPRAQALAQARNNIDAWTREIDGEGLDAILVTASGCGTTVKDYGFMLRTDPAYAEKAKRVSALAHDITEYLATLKLPRRPNRRR